MAESPQEVASDWLPVLIAAGLLFGGIKLFGSGITSIENGINRQLTPTPTTVGGGLSTLTTATLAPNQKPNYTSAGF